MSLRKNVTLKNNIAKWLEEKSKEMGISQSAIISIALTEYAKKNK
jgi:hypothetical protein